MSLAYFRGEYAVKYFIGGCLIGGLVFISAEYEPRIVGNKTVTLTNNSKSHEGTVWVNDAKEIFVLVSKCVSAVTQSVEHIVAQCGD